MVSNKPRRASGESLETAGGVVADVAEGREDTKGRFSAKEAEDEPAWAIWIL